LKEKTLFIINPEAGKGRGRKILPQISRILAGYSNRTEIIQTERANHATEIVKLYRNDFKKICVAGGDGTLNEIVNGLDGSCDNILGVIPIGSGNDFARTAGISRDLSRALRTVLEDHIIRKVDTGFLKYKEKGMNGLIIRKFLNSAGIGFDAIVSDQIKKTRYFKGLPLYISAVVQALFMYRVMDVKAEFDGYSAEGRKLLIAISNGKTYGGGLKVNPGAEVDDGYLDACLIGSLPVWQIVRDFQKLIRGKHGTIPGIEIRKFKSAGIKTGLPVYIHADGEVISQRVTEVEAGLNSGKLQFIFAR
jgi:YegS/Rv2252/BmrU family lipid kinase